MDRVGRDNIAFFALTFRKCGMFHGGDGNGFFFGFRLAVPLEVGILFENP